MPPVVPGRNVEQALHKTALKAPRKSLALLEYGIGPVWHQRHAGGQAVHSWWALSRATTPTGNWRFDIRTLSRTSNCGARKRCIGPRWKRPPTRIINLDSHSKTLNQHQRCVGAARDGAGGARRPEPGVGAGPARHRRRVSGQRSAAGGWRGGRRHRARVHGPAPQRRHGGVTGRGCAGPQYSRLLLRGRRGELG